MIAEWGHIFSFQEREGIVAARAVHSSMIGEAPHLSNMSDTACGRRDPSGKEHVHSMTQKSGEASGAVARRLVRCSRIRLTWSISRLDYLVTLAKSADGNLAPSTAALHIARVKCCVPERNHCVPDGTRPPTACEFHHSLFFCFFSTSGNTTILQHHSLFESVTPISNGTPHANLVRVNRDTPLHTSSSLLPLLCPPPPPQDVPTHLSILSSCLILSRSRSFFPRARAPLRPPRLPLSSPRPHTLAGMHEKGE